MQLVVLTKVLYSLWWIVPASEKLYKLPPSLLIDFYLGFEEKCIGNQEQHKAWIFRILYYGHISFGAIIKVYWTLNKMNQHKYWTMMVE